MFIDPLPTMPTRYRGFSYVIDRDRSKRNRREKAALRLVVYVTDPKTGKTNSIGHGHTSVVAAGLCARSHIDAIANCREGWQHG